METTTLKEVEGAMPIKSDFEYIRGLDSQGNPIRLNKADVAKVLEGLIPGIENRMPQKDDFNWVRAIDAQDNSIKIIKEDFVKEMSDISLSPICETATYARPGLTVAKFKEALIKDIQEKFFSRHRFSERIGYLVLPSCSSLLNKWDSPNEIVDNSAKLSVVVTCMIGGGNKIYANLQFTSYGSPSFRYAILVEANIR